MTPTTIGVLFGSALALSAHGKVLQRSQMAVELSTDGQAWTRALDIDPLTNPIVFGRVTISYLANGGPEVLGLTVAKFQPTIPGWNYNQQGERMLPFEDRARVDEPDYSIDDGDGYSLGRTYGQASAESIALHQYLFAGSYHARFAQGWAYNHPGQGEGGNNVDGSRGINTSGAPTAANLGVSNVLLFTWGMRFQYYRRATLNIDVPRETFRTNTDGERSAAWFATLSSPHEFIEAPMPDTLGAELRLVPAPGAAAGLASGLFGFRRRRP